MSIETNTGNSHTVMMLFRHLLAVAILPVSVTVLVPVWIASRYSIGFALGTSVFALTLQAVGVVVITLGLLLFITSLRRFATEGNGTLAPWDPPKRLVVRGPYRFVRNPMISGIIFILAGEAMLLVSKTHAIWALIFLGINMIYIPLFEEPFLRQRFGEDYVEYCKHVPRIFPRPRPWLPNRVDKNLKVVFFIVLFLSFSTSLTAQRLPVWERVHTFEESVIDMNTSLVTRVSEDITRVRFRWTFDKPEPFKSGSSYKSRLEVIELNCSLKSYRPYHITYFDASGEMLSFENLPGKWRKVTSSVMAEKLFVPACELVKSKFYTNVGESDREQVELERAAEFAHSFAQHLERTKDFKRVVEKFFAADYLNGYLRVSDTKRFLRLKDTAANASRLQLQRFYIASMNAGYLTSLYLISQYPADSEDRALLEKLVPPDVIQLINRHPYTTVYRGNDKTFDFLAENIDSVHRLRSFTNLLEGIGSLMRKHVIGTGAEHSQRYREMLEENRGLYQPKVRVCARNCMGLPDGTKFFEVNVPLFGLQLAEIRGQLKVVSAINSFK